MNMVYLEKVAETKLEGVHENIECILDLEVKGMNPVEGLQKVCEKHREMVYIIYSYYEFMMKYNFSGVVRFEQLFKTISPSDIRVYHGLIERSSILKYKIFDDQIDAIQKAWKESCKALL